MSYRVALEAAGAKVLDFQSFGSYQGEWFALVEFEGRAGWIQGHFGSCTHCDAFEAEFDYAYQDSPDYQERLAKFGRSYLDDMMPAAYWIVQLRERAEWDSESADAADWIERTNTTFLTPKFEVKE
jgi:hypothetical protein